MAKTKFEHTLNNNTIYVGNSKIAILRNEKTGGFS